MTPTTASVKKALREDITDLAGTWKTLNAAIEERVKEIEAEKKAGISPIPMIEFETLVNNPTAINKERIRQRGCLIIKNVFPRELAEGWNTEVENYLERNDYLGQKVNAIDNYFGSLKNSKPQVYGIYWSKPQIEARQHENMFKVQRFLIDLWKDNGQFDKDKMLSYADRIRMREPQDTTFGLSPHLDSGSVERWMEPNYRKTYATIFKGNWKAYHPFDPVSYTHLRAHETKANLVCRLLLEKKNR